MFLMVSAPISLPIRRGKEEEACQLFAQMEQRYNLLKAKVSNVKQRPSVFSGEMRRKDRRWFLRLHKEINDTGTKITKSTAGADIRPGYVSSIKL